MPITVVMILSGGCGCNQAFHFENTSVQEKSRSISIPPFGVVEMYHFHETQQCYTCRLLGELAEETMNTSFRQEIDDGNIIFRSVNVDLPENADIVSRFEPTSSSLMIGYTNETGFHTENLLSLWYKLGDKEAFHEGLTGVIRQRIGDI